jgi:hypothetical protein
VVAAAFPSGVLGGDAFLETSSEAPGLALLVVITASSAADHLLGAALVAIQDTLTPAALVFLVLVVHEIARSLRSIVGRADRLITG